jgi:Rod binding domain-containing protein
MSDFRISTPASSSSSLTQAQSDLAIRGLRNPSTKDSSSKIDKAAHDFESILVGQWLEKAEKSFATVPGTDPDQDRDSGHDQFQSIACQFMAQGLTKTGSFGIASMISKHLAAAEAKQTAGGTPRTASGRSSNVNLSSPMLKNDK